MSIKTCQMLLAEFEEKGITAKAEKLIFEGVGNNDVYNITAPFEQNGELIIAGRVEARDSEQSRVIFFTEKEGKWVPKEEAPIFDLQDPFHTIIAGELILGGVQTYPHPENPDWLAWRTVFYKGQDIFTLAPFFKGPDGMKDLRLTELKSGEIAVVTRPQGEKGGRGKIGYGKIKSLQELSIPVIENAPLLKGQFTEEEWGGANEIHLLENGLLGVLGHIACFDERGDRHYYPMVFTLDGETGEHSPIELIATRSMFLPGESKRPDLVDVVFSGGLVRDGQGKARLYAGISDAEAQVMTIDDPFN